DSFRQPPPVGRAGGSSGIARGPTGGRSGARAAVAPKGRASGAIVTDSLVPARSDSRTRGRCPPGPPAARCCGASAAAGESAQLRDLLGDRVALLGDASRRGA